MKKPSTAGIACAARMAKLSLTEPLSVKRAKFFVLAYGFCTLSAGLIVGMNLFMHSSLSLFWVVLSAVLGALYMTLLCWSVQGLMNKRDQARAEAEFWQLIEVLNDGKNAKA
jgi:hypothetical protein